jgi:hypothetical protein
MGASLAAAPDEVHNCIARGRSELKSRDRSQATTMVCPIYKLFAQTMAAKKQIVCEYEGFTREICVIILGHTRGQEKALTFQYGGQSKSGLPPNGEWRCLFLEKVRNVHLRDGSWRAGDRHT